MERSVLNARRMIVSLMTGDIVDGEASNLDMMEGIMDMEVVMADMKHTTEAASFIIMC